MCTGLVVVDYFGNCNQKQKDGNCHHIIEGTRFSFSAESEATELYRVPLFLASDSYSTPARFRFRILKQNRLCIKIDLPSSRCSHPVDFPDEIRTIGRRTSVRFYTVDLAHEQFI